MDVLFRDQNGNFVQRVSIPVEASRLEGWGAKLSDDSETLIVTLDLEEA